MGWAPGRVELLGNHTDYNGGLVMAAAIDRSTVVVGPAVPTAARPRFVSVNFDQADTFSLDAIEPTESGAWTRYVRGVCWALSRVGRAARVGLRGGHRRRRPPGGRALELGEPPGVGRLVPDPARRGAAADPSRDFTRDVGDLHPHGAGQGAPAVGERVRRGRLGPARPVLQPLRPRRSRPVPRLRHAGPRPAAAGQPRAGDRGVRLEDLATAGRRDVRPAAGGVRARRRPSSATGSPIAASSGSRGCRSEQLEADWDAPRPGRPQAGPARPERERAGAPGGRGPEGRRRRRRSAG